MEIVEIEVSHLNPYHEVRDEDKKDKIKESIIANGWLGRPLLVINQAGDPDDEYASSTNEYQLITGSHRYQAALEASEDWYSKFYGDIPCIVIDWWDVDNDMLTNTTDDDDKVEAFAKVPQAQALMALEVAENYK